jgi:hypothetical protein
MTPKPLLITSKPFQTAPGLLTGQSRTENLLRLFPKSIAPVTQEDTFIRSARAASAYLLASRINHQHGRARRTASRLNGFLQAR